MRSRFVSGIPFISRIDIGRFAWADDLSVMCERTRKQSSADRAGLPWTASSAGAPGNDASDLVLAMHLHPSGGHASNEKPRNVSLSAPIFVRGRRRWSPAPSRSMLQATTCKRKKKKESGTPKDADPYPPHLPVRRAPCKGALAHRRSTTVLAKGSHRPKGSPQARLRAAGATRRVRRRRVTHSQRAPRAPVIVPAGLIPETPGSGGDEPPPAGTASRSDQPGSPADVLHGERD